MVVNERGSVNQIKSVSGKATDLAHTYTGIVLVLRDTFCAHTAAPKINIFTVAGVIHEHTHAKPIILKPYWRGEHNIVASENCQSVARNKLNTKKTALYGLRANPIELTSSKVVLLAGYALHPSVREHSWMPPKGKGRFVPLSRGCIVSILTLESSKGSDP